MFSNETQRHRRASSRAGHSLALCLSALLTAWGSVFAQDAELDNYLIPSDMSGVHFYLITVDVGDSVWDNFGHTALRVYDENNNTDTVFNWGVFDVSGGVVGFSWNFFKGVMNYRLATTAPGQEFAMYRAQQRSVWQDKINLSNPQKEQLYRRLMWNLEPENIEYAYQYFFDNCTTKVRDYLDEALTGRISQVYTGNTDYSFRDQVRDHYQSVPLVGFSLDVLMNSNIDREVSEWEAMYLPLRLRESLLKVPSDVAEDGERLMLLSDSQMILTFEPPTLGSSPYRTATLLLLLPVGLLFLLLKRLPQSYFATQSRFGFKASEISFRVLGLLGVITSLFSGIYGWLMLGSWFISAHLDTHHNVNLLLFWPTDLLGVLIGMRWLLLREPWPLTHNSSPFINYYLLAHVLALIVYSVMAYFDLTAQSISSIALAVAPGFMLFTLLIWIVGFQPAKPKNMFF